MNQNIIAVITEFIKLNYSNHHVCMITGSFADGENNEYLVDNIDLLKEQKEGLSKFDLCVQLDVVYRFFK